MKKIVIIDGQGGRIGSLIADGLKGTVPGAEIFAVGTNSAAAVSMKRAGADFAATGENAVIVGCRDADVIAGPIGILVADALLGELSPEMARAVGQSRAQKVLIPVSRCKQTVVGVMELSLTDLVNLAVKEIQRLCSQMGNEER